MIRISGNTFSVKDELKDFGGKWNGDLKAWEFRDGTNVERWRGKPGLVISNTPAQPKADKPDPVDDDFWDRLINSPKRKTEPVQHGTGEPSVYGNDITYQNAFMQKNPPVFAGFRSFPDLIEFVENIPASVSTDRANGRNTAWETNDGAWSGSASMRHAIDLARNGWRRGTALALEAGEVISGDHATQRQRRFAVAGGRVNVGRMLSGNPLHMVSRPRQEGHKVITLFVQVWMSAGITPENAIIRAAAVAAIADVLQSNGYSCEIVSVGTATFIGSNPGFQTATVIKSAGEPLNIENVAFALGHPSMLRRFMFAVAACDTKLRGFWSYMGQQINAFDPDDLPPGSFYIPKLLLEDQNAVTGDTFKDRVRSLFPLIVPENLPIDLK